MSIGGTSHRYRTLTARKDGIFLTLNNKNNERKELSNYCNAFGYWISVIWIF